MASVLITGGAGFIGRRLALALRADGHAVAVYDNFHPQVHTAPQEALEALEALEAAGIAVTRADIRDGAALGAALAAGRPDTIVHLAAETGTGQSYDLPAHYCDVNVTGTSRLVEAIRAARADGIPVARVVLAGSRAVYGEGACVDGHGRRATAVPRRAEDMAAGDFAPKDAGGQRLTPVPTRSTVTPVSPASVYASTKLMQEWVLGQALWQSGISCAILRLQNVYGAGQALHNPYTGVLSIFARQLLDGRTLNIFEDGAIVRDFVYVTDVVEAFRLLCTAKDVPLHPVDIGTGRETTILEVARMMMSALGLPTDRFRITGDFRPGDIRYAVADLTDAREGLGFAPSVPLEEGIERLVAWTRETL
ncbi:MAG: NAD-dependent epimerase/dehydratase family protein [Pseudomonadota bacterium]